MTGASSGIGRAMSVELARRGARVFLVARDPVAGESAREDAQRAAEEAASGGEARLEIADLSRLVEVRDLAERVRARAPSLHVLANNAGIYLARRHVTDEGHEVSLAVNHLAPFLLVNLLRPSLRAAGGARVVTTGSMAYTTARLDLDDLSMEKRWSPLRQYANTKLAALLATREVARRFAADGVVANTYHPGGVRSGMAQDEPNFMGRVMRALGPFLRSPEKGAETGLYLATAEDLEARGELFVDLRPRPLRGPAADPQLAEALWERSAALTALTSSAA